MSAIARTESPAGVAEKIEAVSRELDRYDNIAVAVSGGIDSLTLATLANRRRANRVEMFHSLTASVPLEATERTRELAARLGWRLHVIDANEFARDEYLSNPVNRCFYCKQSLYDEIARHTGAQVVSGANTDDLGEYRPGLLAARDAGARHPFVDAGIDKATIRAIARAVGLGDLAEIPASPCLSSRVETGIRITRPMLRQIEEAEVAIRARIAASAVRCRVRGQGVVIEIDAATLGSLAPALLEEIAANVSRIFATSTPPAFEPYRNGSAFLIEKLRPSPYLLPRPGRPREGEQG